MGCGGSKVDGLEAVALCRGRSDLLAAAISHRHRLAASHAAYFSSLRSLSAALRRLLDVSSDAAAAPSPLLPLPPQRKAEPSPLPSPSLSCSGSGSHIDFHSEDNEDSDSDPDSPLHSSGEIETPGGPGPNFINAHYPRKRIETPGGAEPILINSHYARSHIETPGGSEPNFINTHYPRSHIETPGGPHPNFINAHCAQRQIETPGGEEPNFSNTHYARNHIETPGGAEPNSINTYYARSQPPPSSMSYEHRPPVPETIQFEQSYYPYPYPVQNPTFNPYSYPQMPNYYGYGGIDGYFGASNPPPAPAPLAPSSSAPPPPPPSPPRTSSWDFLNPFESYSSYYQPYTPSRSSKEVREEEGIPDLEEEHEVVKEAYDERKFVPSTSAAREPEEYSKASPPSFLKKNRVVDGYGEDSRHGMRSTAAGRSEEDEGNVVEKSVAHEEPRRMAAPRKYQDVSGVASEITTQFDVASESSLELSRMLEVGKRHYCQKNSVYQVPSKMMHVMTPPSSSKTGESLKFEEDMVMNSRSMSSTLQKLYMWEKKLYHEVKAEEKMRLLHDKNCKQLKRLDERGAEAPKIDFTRTMILKLSTKIRVSIQVVESISKKINKLRNDELGPQINEIIQGLMRMWGVMLECQQTQCRAISEAKCLDFISSGRRLSDAGMDALVQFELELLKWSSNFSDWINAQKSYVKALNGWLTLCLHYEPEVTPDGIPPYSPGRLGAPPVFVICNFWSQAMDRICEKEVVEAMQGFATNVKQLREHQYVEQQQQMLAKARERDVQTIHKELDALRKKLVLVSGQNGGVTEVQSLQFGLKQVFDAMEIFTGSSVKAYEELHLRSEEERLVRENLKVP